MSCRDSPFWPTTQSRQRRSCNCFWSQQIFSKALGQTRRVTCCLTSCRLSLQRWKGSTQIWKLLQFRKTILTELTRLGTTLLIRTLSSCRTPTWLLTMAWSIPINLCRWSSKTGHIDKTTSKLRPRLKSLTNSNLIKSPSTSAWTFWIPRKTQPVWLSKVTHTTTHQVQTIKICQKRSSSSKPPKMLESGNLRSNSAGWWTSRPSKWTTRTTLTTCLWCLRTKTSSKPNQTGTLRSNFFTGCKEGQWCARTRINQWLTLTTKTR